MPYHSGGSGVLPSFLPSFFLLVAPLALASPPDEGLGNLSTVNCSIQWTGPCFSEWTAVGEEHSLTAVAVVGQPANLGIEVVPGNVFPNGIGGSFPVTPEHRVWFELSAIPLDGTADVGIRVVFRDASGTEISTHTHVEFIEEMYHQLAIPVRVPAGAVVANVLYGAVNASTPNTRIIIGANHADPSPGRRLFPRKKDDGWIDWENPAPCPPPPEYTCSMDCPPGTKLRVTPYAGTPPECMGGCRCDCRKTTGGSSGNDENIFETLLN